MSIALTGPETDVRAPPDAGVVTATLEGTLVQRLLVTDDPITIGRLPDNRLVLPHPHVSRRHAEIRRDRTGLVVTDLGSSAGTLVDGQRLLANQPVLLNEGLRVRIGPYELSYVPAAAGVRAPAAPPAAPARPEPRTPSTPTVVPGRPTYPVLLPVTPQSRYLDHLPAIFQENDFLGRMLLINEAIWEPLEQRQDHLAMYFDPITSPAEWLSFLAWWVGLTLNDHWPEPRRRRLVLEAMDLYRWRGTAFGLARALEVCTGLPVTVTEEPAPYVCRVRVAIPPDSDISPAFIEELVRLHKPAHVGYVLEVSR